MDTDKNPVTQMQEEEDAHRLAWQLGDYVGEACKFCSRMRVCLCTNGNHRCEKCGYVPELDTHIFTDLL